MASGMPWIKLYTEFLDDPKVGFLDEVVRFLLIELFLIAGECDAEGYLANGDELLTKEHIAWRLRIPAPEFMRRWDALEAGGFVAEEDDGALVVVKFQERQGRSQSEKREQWRNRKRRQRKDTAGQPEESGACHAGITEDDGGNHAPRSEGESDHNHSEAEGDQHQQRPALPVPLDDDASPLQELLDAGMTKTRAKIVVETRTPKRIRDWVAHVAADPKISNPGGYLWTVLGEQDEDAPPPRANSPPDDGRRQRRRYVEGEFGDAIQH